MAKGIKTGGRQKGSVNKTTAFFREAVSVVYRDIGGDKAFAQWARENPSEYYRIAARLIPLQVNVPEQSGGPVFSIVLAAPALEVTPALPACDVNQPLTTAFLPHATDAPATHEVHLNARSG